MKKNDVILLLNLGFGQVTNHSLPVEHAYKVVKARKELASTFEGIQKDEEALRNDAGITDPQAFDEELKALRDNKERTAEQEAKLKEMEETLSRYLKMRSEMLNEEVTLNVKTMPYDAWHKLQVENAEKEWNGKKMDLLSGFVEDTLEGILWNPPTEEDSETK